MTGKTPGKCPLRVGLISLGCAKNLVDAEIMLGSLLKDGIEITNDAAQADAVIVNTCSFIDAAQEESVDAILESAEVREASNRGQSLIVSGCLPQRFRDELPGLLPEVDAFMGIDQVAQAAKIVRSAIARRGERIGKHPTPNIQHRTSKERIAAQLDELSNRQSAIGNRQLIEVNHRPTFIPDFATPRFRLTPGHFAYVKIAEGCNHPCSFCIIPRMRGSHRSRQQADIVAEVKALLAGGVKEINLISQDSTYYGLDLRLVHSGTGVSPVRLDEGGEKHAGKLPAPLLRPSRAISSPEKFSSAVKSLPPDSTTVCTLLRELNSLPGDFWIRLLYTHPAHWTNELIQTIAECPKVARYVDIPLQHIHENMLERMRRETSQQYIVDLIKRIRAGVPGIALRTTFIVGFPGETEASFETLLDFIRETKFERLGVFTYSREDGTRACAMAGQIPDKIKKRRRELVMGEQHKIARQISKSFVGRKIKVLIEGNAHAKQLQAGSASSWEHGLVREAELRTPNSELRTYLVARGEADAPDIDGRVYVHGKLPIGEFAEVKIIGHTDYDLIAKLACNSNLKSF